MQDHEILGMSAEEWAREKAMAEWMNNQTCEHPENKLRVGPRVPMRWGSSYSQHCECGAWRALLHRPGPWQAKEAFEAALAADHDQ